MLILVLGAAKVGGWALAMAAEPPHLCEKGLWGLLIVGAVVGLGWLVLAVASWLDGKLSDAMRRFR